MNDEHMNGTRCICEMSAESAILKDRAAGYLVMEWLKEQFP